MKKSDVICGPDAEVNLRSRAMVVLGTACAVCVLGFYAPAAHASAIGIATGGGWTQALTAIARWLQGPVAKGIATILLILLGLGVASGEAKGLFKRFLQISFGLSIAFAAASWLSFLFPNSWTG